MVVIVFLLSAMRAREPDAAPLRATRSVGILAEITPALIVTLLRSYQNAVVSGPVFMV
ncbi:hypothetical protein [Nocardia sp. A7]|uniref:hypothetical protein n=1 Tax=Nocardia sp. A7 TaxID=2789274 RepID=UPI00397B0900